MATNEPTTLSFSQFLNFSISQFLNHHQYHHHHHGYKRLNKHQALTHHHHHHRYKRLNKHRQRVTILEINDIKYDGFKSKTS